MRRVVKWWLVILSLVVSANGAALAADPVCVPMGDGTLRCTIARVSDCNAIRDYPYARNLFCPAAFSAAREMVSLLEQTLGAPAPTSGFFYYYQTLADPQHAADDRAQTTIACLDTPAPYPAGRSVVVGAGTPLCHLAAYVTSPGPVPAGSVTRPRNPVPTPLRAYPTYFSKLYSPAASFPLTKFRSGSIFDPIVEGLGAGGHDGFVEDYPQFSPIRTYDPASWRLDARYQGISGGGGGGWGGEIAVLGPHASPSTLLSFGGGGGGGMTSTRRPASSVLGAGGGGGMQFANGYVFQNKHYTGLGLGAGVGSAEAKVQYSYNDYPASGRPPLPVHQYNPAVIAEYQTQLVNLTRQLKSRYSSGKTIVLMGGGGMGAGTEYLMENGQEFVPPAMSTQAGFQFSYVFHAPAFVEEPGVPSAFGTLAAEQQALYEALGDDYRIANRQAYEACGRDYSNFTCMCPRAHATVICLVGQQIGDPKKIPGWLQQRHCSDDAAATAQVANGLTSYQQLLLDAARDATPPCTGVLMDYFTGLNSPAGGVSEPRPGPAVSTLVGKAEKVGSGLATGKARLSGTATEVGAVDLRQVTVTLHDLLNEEGGAGELATGRDGGGLLPLSLPAARGSKPDEAVFETPTGAQPKVRVELKQRDPDDGELEFSITLEGVVIRSPVWCHGAPEPSTLLATTFTLSGGVEGPTEIGVERPWRCRSDELRAP